MQTTNATTNDDGNYTSAYTPDVDGKYLVNAPYGGANDITVKTGLIDSFSGVNLTTDDVVMIYKDRSRLYATLLNLGVIQ